jgi:hypothetical protein
VKRFYANEYAAQSIQDDLLCRYSIQESRIHNADGIEVDLPRLFFRKITAPIIGLSDWEMGFVLHFIINFEDDRLRSVSAAFTF